MRRKADGNAVGRGDFVAAATSGLCIQLVFPDARAQTSNTPQALCFLSRDEADSLVAMKVKTDYIGLKKKLLIRAYRK